MNRKTLETGTVLIDWKKLDSRRKEGMADEGDKVQLWRESRLGKNSGKRAGSI